MPPKITPPDVDDLVQRYLAGESPKQLCRDRNFSVTVIMRILEERGIKRGGSEANRIIWSRRTKKQRAHQVAAAHKATRGRKVPFDAKCRMALGRQGRMDPTSSLEPMFDMMMQARGVVFDGYQTAVGPYNADFTFGRIAVETVCRSRDSLRTRAFEKRCRYFFDRGWSLVLLWIDARKWKLTPEVADYVAPLLKELRRNPPSICEYRVIWGAGDFVFRRSAEDNDLSFVPPLRSSRDLATGRYQTVSR